MTIDTRALVAASAARAGRYEDAIAGAYAGGAEDDRLAALAAMAVADAERLELLARVVEALDGGAGADEIRGWFHGARSGGPNLPPWYFHLLPDEDA